jgi:hypothetical protein
MRISTDAAVNATRYISTRPQAFGANGAGRPL